ncbi:hypothetical protein SAMN05444392_101248 [Seinonella peptonophila]|uniref:CAAX prenyl protease 2/Lysostaphin resistance protein A-like domain-containing protein n=1 Tax=Seinonella peptonophila TaxID=112248 RepID=A0A1M4T0V6_9BACL|nr:type II CAAX endopeptidase family protein [Seinonella peptonophila]SHE38064.1 hypothetical protein SAMN05444392_101248 [Seinonella peptonophila]
MTKTSHANNIYQILLQLVITICGILLLSMIAFFIPIPKQYINFFPILLFATIGLYFLFEHKHGGSLGFRDGKWLKNVSIGLIFGMVSITIIFLILFSIEQIAVTKVQLNTWPYFFLYLFLFSIVAIQEELFIRGYIMSMFNRYYNNSWVAIIVSSLCFAFLHSQNPGIFTSPFPMINIFLAGILLGVMRSYSKSIWMAVGFHLTWNHFQGVVYGFHVSGTPIPSILVSKEKGHIMLNGGSFGIEGSAVTTLLFMVSICLVVFTYRKQKTPTE